MEINQKSFFEKAYNPFVQALIVLLASIIFSLIGKMVNALNIIEVSDSFPWQSTASFLLFFAVFNSIFSLSSGDINKYWTKSIISFGLLAGISGLIAYFLSSISIYDAGSYSWIYIILTFSYLVFLSIMGFMKAIVEFAQKEEWTSPKQRNEANRNRRRNRNQ